MTQPPDGIGELNHTELVALCMDKGFPRASRDTPLRVLREVLLGKLSPDELGTPIDRRRKAIAKFLAKHEEVIPQLRCDLDHANCPEARVLGCFRSNDEIEKFL
jgi:hypothetical protein